jgi:hypothetical protein
MRDRVPFDALLFAKHLGRGGRELAASAQAWIDLNSRKSDFSNALAAVRQASRFLEETKQLDRPPEDREYVYGVLRALNAQAVQLYYRGSDVRGGRLSLPLHKWILNDEEKAKHESIIAVRSSFIAHHVRSRSSGSNGSKWMHETMYLIAEGSGLGVGIQLLRYNYKSETTWDIVEMAGKAVERIQPLEDQAAMKAKQRLAEALRDPNNLQLLDRCRMPIPDGYDAEQFASEMGTGKMSFAFKEYPEKGSPFEDE